MNTSIDIPIRDHLNERRGNWRELASRSGISYSWLSKFANGHISNPGLRTLERLDDALARLGNDPKHLAMALIKHNGGDLKAAVRDVLDAVNQLDEELTAPFDESAVQQEVNHD